MRITHFTLRQDGTMIGSVAIREQAVNAGRLRAASTGRSVSVVAHLENGGVREVIYHPDGKVDKVWQRLLNLTERGGASCVH